MENHMNVGDQNTQQIGQNPVINPNQINEKPKVNFWIISTVIFALLFFGAISYYVLGLKSQKLRRVLPAPTLVGPTTVPISTTTDETKNWKTYTNSVNHYSIKIPQDWIMDDHKGVFINIPGEVTFTPPSEMNITVDSFRTKIAITSMSTQKVRYSLNTQEQFDEWLSMTPASDVRRLSKVDNLKIDGLDTVKFISTTLPGDATEPFFSIVAWFRRDGNNYYIEFGGSEKTVNNYIKVFDQILSTFKFINSPQGTQISPTISTQNYPRPSTWKSVNVANLNISICLPPKWESDDWGHIIFNRDPAYKPDVAWFNKFDYKGGSRRDEYINMKVQYEYEPDKLKNETKISELTINGQSVLKISIPSFPEAIVFVLNNKLYEVQLASWNLVNDSQSAFLKDVYTVVGCVKSI